VSFVGCDWCCVRAQETVLSVSWCEANIKDNYATAITSQRLFKRWAGVSPKQFLQYLTLDHARQCLSNEMSVLETAFDSGLSAPARLNELFVRLEAITPAEFKQQGKGIEISYGFHHTPFGMCLIGVTDRGLSGLEFCATAAQMAGLKSSADAVTDKNKEQTLKAMADRF